MLNFWIHIVIVVIVICFFFWKFLIFSTKSQKEDEDILVEAKNFLKSNSESGHVYELLVKKGFFSVLRMSNHSPQFDDSRQLEDFKRFATPEVAAALKKIGETYE